MDQEGANYFSTDSTFSVPIILSSEGLDSFENSTIPTDTDPIKDDSNEVPQVLQSDIIGEHNINSSDKVVISITQAENVTECTPAELDAIINQSPNLKVCMIGNNKILGIYLL